MMIQSCHTPVVKLAREIQTLSMPGVFLHNYSTLGLVSRRHIHNSIVLYKQTDLITKSVLISWSHCMTMLTQSPKAINTFCYKWN